MRDGEVEGAMQTPDGAWRVEVVRRGRTRWYRIVHGDDVIDWLSIAAVERILEEAGVDRRSLIDAGPETRQNPEGRTGMPTDRAARRRPPGDAGFSLVEVLVAIAVITVVTLATVPFLTTSVSVVGQERGRQAAIELANDALERARALTPSALLAGRSDIATQAQWDAVDGGDKVAPYLASMERAWDPLLTAGDEDGDQAPLPTGARPVIVNGTTYQQNWYVGRCWQARVASNGAIADCGATVAEIPFFRVVVAVTWPEKACAPDDCAYIASTMVSPQDDPIYDTKRPPPTVTDPGDQGGYLNETVNLQVTGGGGLLPRTWSATGLPPGLSLSPEGGLITGRPTATGVYTVTVEVRDRDGSTDDSVFTWTVTTPPALTPPGNQVSRTGTAVSFSVASTGGLPSFTWTASALPAGLTINSATGTITGTPTTVQTRTPTVTVTDGRGRTASLSFSWRVLTPVSLPNPGAQSMTIGDNAGTFQLPASGGAGTPYSWQAQNLPDGLVINASTGAITGTIRSTGRFITTVSATDSAGGAGGTATVTAICTVNPRTVTDLRITAPSLASPNQTTARGTPVTLTPAAGATPSQTPYTWTATNLPPGLSVSGGKVTGTPTTAGTYLVTLKVTDAVARTAFLMFTWTVT